MAAGVPPVQAGRAGLARLVRPARHRRPAGLVAQEDQADHLGLADLVLPAVLAAQAVRYRTAGPGLLHSSGARRWPRSLTQYSPPMR